MESHTLAGRGVSQEPLRTLLRASCSSFLTPLSCIIVFSIHVFTPLSSIIVFSIHVLTPLSAIIEFSIDICAQAWAIIDFLFDQNVQPLTAGQVAQKSINKASEYSIIAERGVRN